LSTSNPTNATLREYLGEAFNLSAPLLESKGNYNLALEYYRNSNRIFADLRAADPANSLARANFALSDLRMGQELVLKHDLPLAFPCIREAIGTYEVIEHKSRYDLEGLAQSYEALAMAYASLANQDKSHSKKARDLHEAQTWLQKSRSAWDRNSNPGYPDPVAVHESARVRAELATCESELAKL
jgi:tetratricopeptide (TPR) repeat protein